MDRFYIFSLFSWSHWRNRLAHHPKIKVLYLSRWFFSRTSTKFNIAFKLVALKRQPLLTQLHLNPSTNKKFRSYNCCSEISLKVTKLHHQGILGHQIIMTKRYSFFIHRRNLILIQFSISLTSHHSQEVSGVGLVYPLSTVSLNI